MNHAHPMITPIAAIPPQKISELYDNDAACVYKIIWDNTLSHIKRPIEINEKLYNFSSSIGDFCIKFINNIFFNQTELILILKNHYSHPILLLSQ